MIPLSRVTVTAEMKQAILDVVDSGKFILGPEVRAFEREFAGYIGVSHAVAVSQGTAAIQLALQAIGVVPGDEVLVPSMTAFPTIEGVVHAGATPVFVDNDVNALALCCPSRACIASSPPTAPRATRTPGTMRALSRARAATIRAAMRMTPYSVVCRVYHTSRTRTRIWLMTAAVRPGGAGTGLGRRFGHRGPQGGEFRDRGLAVHAVPLVSVPVCRTTVGDLFEERIDIGAAWQRDRGQQMTSWLPAGGWLVH